MKVMLVALLLAGSADEEVLNRFNDPFEAVSHDIADCPEPRGPRITAAEARVQAHHRAERGTSCWLKGECSEPNAFRYDADIAAALRQRLEGAAALKPSSLWFTVQGRVVYFEGCVERLSPMPALHAPLLVVANTRHSPSYGCALRLDQGRFDAPFGHGRKPLNLCKTSCDC